MTPWIKKHTRKIHGTYLGNIYGKYKQCILVRNIHKHLWYKGIRNTDPMGRPPKAARVFLMIFSHRYLWILLIHSWYIPYMFPRYVPCIFPCVFLNLWSQEKTSPYRKTTFILFFNRFYTYYIFINIFKSFCEIICFYTYFL